MWLRARKLIVPGEDKRPIPLSPGPTEASIGGVLLMHSEKFYLLQGLEWSWGEESVDFKGP